jgi:hypothetical protein
MTRRVIADADVWRGVDGYSELVISRALDGRIHITVNGTTASFGAQAQAEIAAFIAGGE